MNKGLLIVYQVIGIAISFLFLVVFAFAALAIVQAGFQTDTLTSFLLSSCLVAYGLLSRYFFRNVLKMQKPIPDKYMGWLQAVAVICLVLLALLLVLYLSYLVVPSRFSGYAALMQKYYDLDGPTTKATITNNVALASLLATNLILLIMAFHCVWTLVLVRKLGAYFK